MDARRATRRRVRGANNKGSVSAWTDRRHYAKGMKWLVVDKAETKQVHELYAMPQAIDHARDSRCRMARCSVYDKLKEAAR